MANKWQFWVDRGGTFTDIVGRRPDGSLVSAKFLSENPTQYKDAALYGISKILGETPLSEVESLKLGTTVATNALLERKGEDTLFVTTKGYKDSLLIGDQRRPELFALNVTPPAKLFKEVIEVDERLDAHGEVLKAPDPEIVKEKLETSFAKGLRSVAIVFMHGYKNPAHENLVAELARQIGFSHVVTSYETASVMKFFPRASTTVVDAYLSPNLNRYVSGVEEEAKGVPLYFMQSSGGLAEAHHFKGKDALLSGPAGGIVGAVKAAANEGFEKIITFDMGGTSTDVAHFAGEFERAEEEELDGIKLKVPSLKIHTVAAGGGSICSINQGRFKVGPESAGANPGPACYRNGGPLTVTDCNLILGNLNPELFPKVFGPAQNQGLDKDAALAKMSEVLKEVNLDTTPEKTAEGFIAVAVEHMARAVKKISVQKGHDIKKYALVSFGGAGGQHAAQVADALGIETIIIHPLAGVLSALGIGQTGLLRVQEKTVEEALDESGLKIADQEIKTLQGEVKASLEVQGASPNDISFKASLRLKYQGSDTALPVPMGGLSELQKTFEAAHQTLFGFFEPDKTILIEAAQVEGKTPGLVLKQTGLGGVSKPRSLPSGVYDRDCMGPKNPIKGPATIIEDHGTNVVPEGWQATKSNEGNLILTRHEKLQRGSVSLDGPDPIMLEIFNNRFMTIAEEMGAVLEKTAHSVNIKERLDFSCAIFDGGGDLVANAPHMPVHLGSMSESVKIVAVRNQGKMGPGDAFILNDPYHGGTHLPDVTIVVPVFLENKKTPDFFVASRGHHADIGGITPGSMPPNSGTIEEEGVLFDNEALLKEGIFQEKAIRGLLTGHKFPSRNPDQNIADIKAQVAACQRGFISLKTMCQEFGFEVVSNYMNFIQDNAEAAVKGVIEVLKPGEISYPLDNGLEVKVKIIPDAKSRTATIDFTGTSAQHEGNFNAPKAVTLAAVLYVFRCLVGQEIPLNAGCLKPLNLIVPEGSFLNPKSPGAVVAGNVETSQAVTNALLLALGKLAAAQGTMNNLTFGNEKYQYYETIAGGYGAGDGFDGVSARQVHMTNSRLTDPEVLEWRFPVLVDEFSIRIGSGGKGKWSGGHGAVRKIRVLENMEVSFLSSHREVPPPGLNSGAPGLVGKNSIDRQNGTRTNLKGCDNMKIKAGDTIHIETPGGGGFGKD